MKFNISIHKTHVIWLLVFCSTMVLGQDHVGNRQKGDFFFYWGYNRSIYSDSDIRFKGNGYDFTLKKVAANDRPTDFSVTNYFKPANISIPQYVYRFGYFFQDNLNVSIGMDHLKYVMPKNQMVGISGYINIPGNPYSGNYQNSNAIVLSPEFLTYEHTDGLNYLNVDFDYYVDAYSTKMGKFGITTFVGGGAGMLIPKSNVQLMSASRSDVFHIAGYGAHVNVGVQFSFWRYLFIRTQAKGGFMNLPDVLTRVGDGPDRASQHFWFGMWDFAFGWQWQF